MRFRWVALSGMAFEGIERTDILMYSAANSDKRSGLRLRFWQIEKRSHLYLPPPITIISDEVAHPTSVEPAGQPHRWGHTKRAASSANSNTDNLLVHTG